MTQSLLLTFLWAAQPRPCLAQAADLETNQPPAPAALTNEFPDLLELDLDFEAPLSIWDTSVRATLGAGYRDNVLRTSVAPESSGFFIASGDLFLSRLSEDGSQFVAFVLGEETRYFDAPSVKKEQLFSTDLQYSAPVKPFSELGGEVQYIYFNQIVDASETEVNLRRVLVEGNGLTMRADAEYLLPDNWALELEATGVRQAYRTELDSYWEGAGRASLVRTYGYRSEFSLGYQSLFRLYDTRVQYTRSGDPIEDTSLTYWQNELKGQLRHYFDSDRRWRSTTRLSFLFSQDNGSDYFGYDRFQFSQQLRWQNDHWEIRGQARLGWYFYHHQRIPALIGSLRQRAYYILDLRIERRLGKYMLLYAAAEREWDLSNDPLDEYNDWMASGGIGTEF